MNWHDLEPGDSIVIGPDVFTVLSKAADDLGRDYIVHLAFFDLRNGIVIPTSPYVNNMIEPYTVFKAKEGA